MAFGSVIHSRAQLQEFSARSAQIDFCAQKPSKIKLNLDVGGDDCRFVGLPIAQFVCGHLQAPEIGANIDERARLDFDRAQYSRQKFAKTTTLL